MHSRRFSRQNCMNSRFKEMHNPKAECGIVEGEEGKCALGNSFKSIAALHNFRTELRVQ